MDIKTIINAAIYTGEGKIDHGYVRFAEKILEVGPMECYKKNQTDQMIDGSNQSVIPGMIDVHTHGGYGVDVMDADVDKLHEMGKRMLEEGITTYFPTTITQEHSAIETALQAVQKAAEHDKAIAGIHLEGPFISDKRAGAQPIHCICEPDPNLFKKWHEASGRLIKLVTYAPEATGAKVFEEWMIEQGIVPSVGHSDALRSQLKHSRASHCTHLFNGMRGLHHREPGVAGHVLLEEKIQVEMIVDGIHIHPDMVKLAYKLKGAKGICVITDAMRAKGMPDGDYELGGQKVIVANGEARLENGSLAGSVLTMDQAFRNIMAFTGCSVEEAVMMTSGNQAREFHLENKGAIQTGKDADLVLMDADFYVKQAFRLGGKS
ncbi:N-acetylglucosamine-6-phosphate deacetylase [Bacillus chungangensis]|uniref:N-acetylglucosamine-6-phosphate deacetylase n=1 Tax=Bacillus chungangensis TaxID=587633 RepID=A0ABT9WV53_9BACI|nr:N-acetylglucosamine-6-phosphate deacetylase [Bacillus chungangensis]MDQ0177175.1 N-acetylglucosamine-6-phosphate deacetylase [Bacillus chungangensis]